MANSNCLQFATRGDGNDAVPSGVWDLDGWGLFALTNPQNAKAWSSLAIAIPMLVLTKSSVKMGKIIVPASKMIAAGVELMSALVGKSPLTWTANATKTARDPKTSKFTTVTPTLPSADGTIVMGLFEKRGFHYFVRINGEWKGVPGLSDTQVYDVAVTGNSTFAQGTASGPVSGKILGWFS
jgi:hypothetical protein